LLVFAWVFFFFFAMLRIKPRALPMLGKHSATGQTTSQVP
jgi:hypothetical protein